MLRTAAKFGWRTIQWVIILAASAAILAAVIVPRIFGGTPYTIISGSMEPYLSPGTLVVVRPVDPKDVAVGDVVTVQLESGKDTVVTHRVTEVQYRLDGQLQFITKGDANDIADSEPRLPVQIRGEVWYHVPYLGYVSQAFSGSQRQSMVGVVIVGLVAYAAWMFIGATRERRKRPGHEAADSSNDDSPVEAEPAELAASRG